MRRKGIPNVPQEPKTAAHHVLLAHHVGTHHVGLLLIREALVEHVVVAEHRVFAFLCKFEVKVLTETTVRQPSDALRACMFCKKTESSLAKTRNLDSCENKRHRWPSNIGPRVLQSNGNER